LHVKAKQKMGKRRMYQDVEKNFSLLLELIVNWL